jgi:mannosyltransferase OCH1-like enzyme
MPELACDYEFHMTENQSARSDVLRIELLYRFGGVYMDRDVRVLRSINRLLDRDFICSAGGSMFSSSVMGMEVGSQFASDLWRMLPGWCLSRQLDIPRTNMIASPLVTELWHKRYRRSTDVATLPKVSFFPFGRGEAVPSDASAETLPDSFGVHSWDGSWLTR